MRLKEQRLWDSMRKNAPRGLWLQRIENLVGDGIPDVLLMGADGVTTWIELKAPTAPQRKTTKLLGKEGLRQSQINWHVKAASKGVRSYVLSRDDQGELLLFHGALAKDLNAMPHGEMRLAAIAKTWSDIFEVIS